MNPMQVLSDYLTDPMRLLERVANYEAGLRFFEPLQRFIEQCAWDFKDRLIVDCGCGLGQVTNDLRAKDLEVLAIDLYPSSQAVIDDVIPMNSAQFPFTADHLALLCRPCRGDWIHATIVAAVERGAPCLYVSKPQHRALDLDPLPYKVELYMSNVGLEMEDAWLITK